MNTHYHNKKILVIGLGISGRSAAKFLLNRGALVTGVDRDPHKAISQDPELHSFLSKGFHSYRESDSFPLAFDLVIVSPGIPHSHPLYRRAQQHQIEIIGEIELACRSIQQPFIGITGTNGKTTVTLLVEHVLNESGKPAAALGNVGTPLTAELSSTDSDKIIVAELSSYQLETLHSQVIDAGVILNVTPDHLDRYVSMDDYAQAKFQMIGCLKPNAPLYIEEKTAQDYRHLLRGFIPKTYGYTSTCDLYTDRHSVFQRNQMEYALLPRDRGHISHEIENQMGAFALCKTMGVTGEQFISALATFKKPPHRIEFVAKIDGVSYYDDSKGTNIDAVIRAVDQFSGNVILIAGGVDKGFSYASWVEAFGGKVKQMCVIGQAAEKMHRELSEKLNLTIFSTLEEAVDFASRISVGGDTVLLSPGCASFDMFRDYAHRGNEFKRIVRELYPARLG